MTPARDSLSVGTAELSRRAENTSVLAEANGTTVSSADIAQDAGGLGWSIHTQPTLPPQIEHPEEPEGNRIRHVLHFGEPKSLRTYTPTQAALTRASGVLLWTADGRPLYDFTSGVLVANLGHYPRTWTRKWFALMGWPVPAEAGSADSNTTSQGEWWPSAASGPRPGIVPGNAEEFGLAVPLTAYNAMTAVEAHAVQALVQLLQSRPGGRRLEQVLWAASGSEAIQKALWAALAFQRDRPMILATRYGFHGKKGLAQAVTGCETDPERDPRVRFISFPMEECRDVRQRDQFFDPTPYERELQQVLHQFGRKIGTLITEPYLGGGGSFHPPKAYLQLLQRFCRENDILFILDEVQSNFGRTGSLFAFETYGLEPDIVVLGKGLGNGVPVAAAAGRADVFAALNYGDASDTYSAHPLGCAAVLATISEYQSRDVLAAMRPVSEQIEAGLVALREYPFVAAVRGEKGGMVWGVEMQDYDGRSASEWANAFVLAAYRGSGAKQPGVHLLGPLAKKVVRIAPPLVITAEQAQQALQILHLGARTLLHQKCLPCS
ncbi:MAG: aminotransferase class III-fold pyridoxal phosphate-dependent enzyme [Thermogemmata sp.]|jgi:4-aminobutyrate aminotransferase-like enzyme|uniref:Aminotransferase class III-fold pyridoxal phosphate-dependent enzyme n=1 Tax=Thermogemmata fonticola TaxID=2755323 RepID=A0A7V8VED5_9BACT|nr:aminotransferase class III-fold pyridoxal phosphate-dependent enzyme [Thermogemmata fonticola]MBA2226396.1 aminotransferase class III-fold pyridoxal phosphate-dependent enzyme [Thermogemmata fonticola]MCX8140151.1 aminotransferase class III-fold pyridoxal phosphate-dependent enzyme [Gemmataceae bacterium]